MASLTLPQEESSLSLESQDNSSSEGSRVTNEKWESVKAETEHIYIDQDHTLAATMETIQYKHGLVACERKWKLKLKEWGFEKNLSSAAMKILVAKAERRAVVEHKDTVFFHGKTQIAPERIGLFKKRKAFREGPAASPSQQTPANVFYYTPCMNNPGDISGGIFGNIRLGSGFNTCNVIMINEFRDRHQSINSSKELHSMSHSSTQRPQEVSAAISDNFSLLPSRLSTLVSYVNYFSKSISWSPEEIKVMYPDWYPATAKYIAEEVLSISIDLSLRDESENISMLTGDPKAFELSAGNNHLAFLQRTTHRHTLLNETTLSLLEMCQIRRCPLENLLKALEMLDTLFQLKLDPSIWLSDSFTLAQIHEAKGENEVAETFYRQAIKFLTDLYLQFGDEPLKAQHYFGKFLMKIDRDEEALLTLLGGYADWLSGKWPIGKTSAFFFRSAECEKNMESLQALHVKMDQDGTFAWVRASASRLQNLHQETSKFVGEEFLLEFMRIGAAYSEMWMFDAANIVFGLAAPRLKPFDGQRHAFERACAYRDYAQHCGRQGSPADQSTQLQLAFRCIKVVYKNRASNEFLYIPESLDELSSVLDNSPGTSQFGQPAGPGPEEPYFESLARQDPELSRLMRLELYWPFLQDHA